MELYLFFLLLGFCGLVVMTLLGVSHGLGHHHSGAGGRAGHAPHAHGAAHGGGGRSMLWYLFLPRVIFSLLLGFGATGYVLRGWLPPVVVLSLAALGAWIFERWMVQRVWGMVMQFASTPARLIEGVLLEEAEAKCNFDAEGNGLVAVEMDGQVRQLLGTLCEEDRRLGVRVRTGERLTVVAVNTRRNSCTVARIGKSS